MIGALLACILLSFSPNDCVVQHGFASQYESEIIMDATVAVRQSWNQDHPHSLPLDTQPWTGFVAVLSCDLIGDTVAVSVEGGEWYYYLVSDCAVRSGLDGTIEWMRTNNILIEFGAREASKLGIRGRGGIEVDVLFMPPSFSPTINNNLNTTIGEQVERTTGRNAH